MPTVHNGIGTWYYGKQRIHRHKSTCPFCNRMGELESFDTTLYFVVLMIPLIPLSRKRIFEQCPTCKKHRVLSLKKWQAQKDKALAEVLEKPDDREMNVSALGLAMAYQDEALFDRLAPMVASDRSNDPAIQGQIGAGYSYFARWAEAEAAYRAALALEDKPEVRRQLGWTLLKQHRPEEATPYFRHILDEKLKDEPGTIFVLIQAFQAEGLHREALELMDQRDAAFPELVGLKEYQKQRKTSKRSESSGKKIKSAILSESGQVGYQEGTWRANIPKFIGPLVVAGLLIWYLAAAIHLGKAREIFLVNGLEKPYTVLVNGREQNLRPGAATHFQVPEGFVAIEFGNLPLEPVQCHIETPFFSRPFKSHTFVINPDQVAVLVWEQAAYSEVPQAGQGQHRFHLGSLLYSFDGLDYEFKEFPDSVSVKQGQTVTKTRVDVLPRVNSIVRLNLATANLEKAQQIEYAKRWVQLHPEDALALYWLIASLPGDDAGLEYIKTGLAERPLRVEWHRLYQRMTEMTHPEKDLRPEYKRIVDETNGDPNARYLLARVEDLDEGVRLLRQAAEGPNPSMYAFHALGFRALSEGQFDDAAQWMQKANRMAPENPMIWRDYKLALFATKQYGRLLEDIQKNSRTPGGNFLIPSDGPDRIRALVAKGDKAGARTVIDEVIRPLPGQAVGAPQQKARADLEMALCCQQKDLPGYLKWASQNPDQFRFELAFLNGKFSDAAQAAETGSNPLVSRGLLYLAARQAGDQKLADQEWPKFLDALDKHDRYAREMGAMLAGRQPVNKDRLRRLPIDSLDKRVLLVVFVKRFPDQTQDLLPLARKLDFFADGTSLCLAKVME